MLRLVMTLSAKCQGSIVPMRFGNTVIQGTRAGGGLPGEPPLTVTVDRVVALYHCANHHQTIVPFISTAKVPRQWVVVPAAAGPAGRDPLNPPPPNEFRMITSAEESRTWRRSRTGAARPTATA
jgi:hypothetical protein